MGTRARSTRAHHWEVRSEGFVFPILRLPGGDWGIIEYTEDARLGYRLHIGYKTKMEAIAKAELIIANQQPVLRELHESVFNPYDMPIVESMAGADELEML